MKQLCEDLQQEYDALDQFVATLDENQWQLITPFHDWTVFDCIAHIAYVDGRALLALTDVEQFRLDPADFVKTIIEGGSMPAEVNPQLGVTTGAQLLALWRDKRSALLAQLRQYDARARLPWYGPDMSARSFATARLMETWAHGQDIYDGFMASRNSGDPQHYSARLKHIAHLGFATFGYSYKVKGLAVPERIPALQLTAPNGDIWYWGDQDASNPHRVIGSAEEFCLVVSQRRHLDDSALQVTEPTTSAAMVDSNIAREWLLLAQCFAGGPAYGPNAGQRTTNP